MRVCLSVPLFQFNDSLLNIDYLVGVLYDCVQINAAKGSKGRKGFTAKARRR
jgi:hypothetical protein